MPGSSAALDAARAVLAIAVVFAHAWANLVLPSMPNAAGGAVDIGFGIVAKFAVFQFFALSGYVIALSTARNMAKNGRFRASDFALARIFRILPPLLLVLALTWGLEFGLRSAGWAQAPAGIAFSRPEYRQLVWPLAKCLASFCGTGTLVRDVNGPLWSLEFEMQLYVVSGLLVWLVDSKRFRLVAGGALLIFLALCFRPYRDGALTLQPVSYAAFACGWLMQRWGDRVTAKLVLPATLTALLACGLLLAVAPHEDLSHLSGGWLISAAFLCFAIAAAGMIKLVGGRPVPRWAARAGGFSYTLYIIHFPLLLFLAFSLYNGGPAIMTSSAIPVGFAAAFAVIALAAVVGFVVEQPKAQQRFVMRWLGSTALGRRLARGAVAG